MDGVIDKLIPSVHSRELKKITANTTSTVTSPMKLFRRYVTESWNKITPNASANDRRNNSIIIFQWVIFF
jgi:hypothetical protein